MRFWPSDSFRSLYLLTICCLLSLSFPVPVQAKSLWIVILPNTSLTQWRQADAPHLHDLLAEGALGMMNMRTARAQDVSPSSLSLSAALTLGAGSRAAAPAGAEQFVPADAPVLSPKVSAGSLYQRRMGVQPPRGSRVALEWPRLLVSNHLGYDLLLGNLADLLERRNITVSATGGALADALAANSAGIIPPLQPQPLGRCVVQEIDSPLPIADRSLGRIISLIKNGQIIVLSTGTDPANQRQGRRLCPVVVWTHRITPGLLTSASTRHLGLVTDTDFAPSVAQYFGLGLDAFPMRPFGSPWSVHPAPHAAAAAAALEETAVTQWQGMHLLPYFALFLGVWMLGAFFYGLRRPLPAWAASLLPSLILAALLSFSVSSFALFALAAFVSSFFAAADFYYPLIMLILLIDLILGASWMQHSLLGYSAIEGARYYGMGNEAMGAMIGAALLSADLARRKLPRPFQGAIWLFLGMIALLFVSPEAGAKAGGFLVALMAFGSYGWLCAGRPLTGKAALAGFSGACGLLLGAAFLDAALHHGKASQLGQAAERLTSGGLGEWGQIIVRKLAVEGHLLWHSAWAVPVWVGIALLSRARPASPDEAPLYLSGWVAVCACLAVNDAGTVAAALCITLLWSRWLMLNPSYYLRHSIYIVQ